MPAFLLPDLGEGLTEAEIVTWHVQAGDTVTVDQPIVEVETAKAVVEVPVPFAGRVTALHGQPGDVVAVGEPLVTVDTAGRFTEPGVVNVFLKLTAGLYLAGLPRTATDRLQGLIADVWPAVEKAESVFQTTLQNGNPVIHPAVNARRRAGPCTLLWYGLVPHDLADVPCRGRDAVSHRHIDVAV